MCSSPSTSLPTRLAKLLSAAGGLIFPVQRLRLANMRFMCSQNPADMHSAPTTQLQPNTSPASTYTYRHSVKVTTAHGRE